MRRPVKLVGLVLATLILPTNQIPANSEEFTAPYPQESAQTQQAGELENELLNTEGVLEAGDNRFSNGRLYDVLTIEGQAGQTIAVTLESIEFDTVISVRDVIGNELASNNNIDAGAGNYHSFVTVTLLTDSPLKIFVTSIDEWSSGEYSLLVEEAANLQALPTLSPVAQVQVEANRLRQIGDEQQRQDRFQQALDSLDQALQKYREIGDNVGEATTLDDQGWVYSSLGQHSRAIELHQQSLAIRVAIGDRRGEASTLSDLGNRYKSLGQYEQAVDFHQQALAIKREIGDYRGEAISLGFLGLVYRDSGQSETAIDFFQQALVLSREQNAQICEVCVLFSMGDVYNDLEQYDQAIESYQQALEIARSSGDRPWHEAVALRNLGTLYGVSGEFSQAVEQHQQSISIMREIGDRRGEADSLFSLGYVFEDFDQIELAIVFMKASIDVQEAIRRDISELDADTQESYAEKISGCYRCLADLLLEQDRIIEAQQVLDLLKIQEIDHYFQGIQRTSETEAGVDFLRPEETILARYNELQASAIAAGQELADLKAIPQEQHTDAQTQRIVQLDDLLTEINSDFNDFARSPEIRELISQLGFEARDASLSLSQLDSLRGKLRSLNAAIFYPLILEDRLELVITVPDSPPLRRTVEVSREELNAAILNFRTALDNPMMDAKTPAQQLYDWLIRPLETDLAEAGVETIIYSPDGQLRYIPLAALHDGDSWLIQQYRINNITAESLTDFTENDAAQPKILAAAYADELLVHTPEVNGTAYTFRGLPGAGLEVATLSAATTFLDEDFSLDAVRPILDEYTVLHFATHAAFVPGVPEDSFILFGNGDTLTLRDVEDWTLNGIDLVVLSACETGVGGLGNGEEILGLGYQFRGAKAVMSSLWQVSDLGTQTLMTEFYTALEQGMTKAAALQAAQQALINGESSAATDGADRAGARPTPRDGAIAVSDSYPGYSHPYYWAPFILIGNGL